VIRAPEDRDEAAGAARGLPALGLVTAYGHVSARAGTAMLITPAADLATVTGSTIVEVPLTAAALPPGAPAEAWAHLALYRARSDAGAIARAQPPAAFAAAAAAAALLPLHGQAAWLGASVPVHASTLLLRSAELAGSADGCLPEGEALLVRGSSPRWGPPGSRSPACGCSRRPATRSSPPRRAVTGLSAQEIASWRAVRMNYCPGCGSICRRTLERS
jgi:hypothetical protein